MYKLLILLLIIILAISIASLVFIILIYKSKKIETYKSTDKFKKIVYINVWSNDFENDIIPTFTKILQAGATHIILAFIVQPDLNNKIQIFDAVLGFTVLTPEQRTKLMSLISNYNANLMISFGGAIKVPCPFDTILDSYYKDPTLLASDLVQITNTYGFHGIDLDIEHLIGKYYKGYCPSGEVKQDTDVEKVSDYLALLSISIKKLNPSLIVSHAPQYPYFGPSYYNVYGLVEQKAKTAIDFYNIQYYNSGDTTTYDLVFVNNPFEAAVAQILSQGVPVDKIVVGKSIQGGEIMDLQVFASWIDQASKDSSLQGWREKAGVMIWELFTIYSQSGKDIDNVINFFNKV